jgi:hypothetical protein
VQHLAPGDRDDGFGGDAGGDVEQGDVDAAVDGGAGRPSRELLLAGFVGQEHRHPGGLGHEARGVEHGAGGRDLCTREGIVGVRGGDLLDRHGLRSVVGHHRPHYFRAIAQ